MRFLASVEKACVVLGRAFKKSKKHETATLGKMRELAFLRFPNARPKTQATTAQTSRYIIKCSPVQFGAVLFCTA